MASALAVRRVLGAASRARPGPPGAGLPPLAAAAAAAAGVAANPWLARRGVRAGARPGGAAQEAGREGAAAGTSYLDLDDDRLLKQCQVDNYRASGPGGQHRNKTSSAVRLVHTPTGVMVTATERRSQHENKAVALKRLRTQIAMKVRGDARGGEEEFAAETYSIPPELAAILPNAKQRLGPKHKDFAKGAKELLDLLVACKLSVADTAKALGLTTGKVSKLITSDNDLLTEVNRLRQKDGLKPLRK